VVSSLPASSSISGNSEPRSDADRVADELPPPARWRRLGRRLLTAGLIAIAVILTLFAAGAAYVITLPGVGDAQRRVAQILALTTARRAVPCRRAS
jgi:hypothetical protein